MGKKHTMRLGDPLSPRQAKRLEQIYEIVRGVADLVDAPLDKEKGDQHFVTELAKYVVGADPDVLDLPFNPAAISPIGAKLTMKQRYLIGDVVFIWIRRFPTDVGYLMRLMMLSDVGYLMRLMMLSRYARFKPAQMEVANLRVGH